MSFKPCSRTILCRHSTISYTCWKCWMFVFWWHSTFVRKEWIQRKPYWNSYTYTCSMVWLHCSWKLALCIYILLTDWKTTTCLIKVKLRVYSYYTIGRYTSTYTYTIYTYITYTYKYKLTINKPVCIYFNDYYTCITVLCNITW